MSLRKILGNVNEWESRVAFLKKDSDYWPEVSKHQFDDGAVALTTLVRICRDGKWYVVHCVETLNENYAGYSLDYLYERMVRSVYNIQVLYKIGSPLDELDEIQISEEERLKKKNQH